MWKQMYDPMNSIFLSALITTIPIFYFLWALAIKKIKGHIAGLTTVGLAILISIIAFKMPVKLAMISTSYGALMGLFPISWIIVSAVFLYKITVKTGQFDIIRNSIVTITEDRRLQTLLIAFSFGAFLEGAAGFGTPVAISAALLTGLGFNPLYAAGLSLIANVAPVAYGAIGIPITVAAKTTGIDAMAISQMIGRQMPFLSLLTPFWLVFIISGWKGMKEVLPAILVSGGSFAIAQYLTSNFIGPELPDITAALLSLLTTALFLKVWKPKQTFRFEDEKNDLLNKVVSSRETYTSLQVIKAWSPFILLTVFVILWGIPVVQSILTKTNILFNIPGLHEAVIKTTPIVPKEYAYEATFKFDWLATAGTAIFLAAFISKFIAGMKMSEWLKTLNETVKELIFPLITIVSVLGLAYIYNYSGMSATLGLALSRTGHLFPFFAPILGWLGVFLTGSDTSANALFGNLQKITANQIGVDPILTVAANTSGGGTGKMISPQSIAIATAATGLVGKEGDLFRFTLKHSVMFVIIVGIMTYIQAYFLTWMIP
ncbi:lactate permease LctP family transporter [Tepidibacillus sp. HK-1]|uniref:lactate permease LctP family transporter n=1 Tax=Tepidibacillus sp. HK-1 TaxID=1883407 RepID=UPI0008534DCA|nr:lactate permease LctP family transporter [Tepidibacillus sp. HK-1]GBF11591.1 L-lactate permease [Tepidibacillus sp. HK-1]